MAVGHKVINERRHGFPAGKRKGDIKAGKILPS